MFKKNEKKILILHWGNKNMRGENTYRFLLPENDSFLTQRKNWSSLDQFFRICAGPEKYWSTTDQLIGKYMCLLACFLFLYYACVFISLKLFQAHGSGLWLCKPYREWSCLDIIYMKIIYIIVSLIIEFGITEKLLVY